MRLSQKNTQNWWSDFLYQNLFNILKTAPAELKLHWKLESSNISFLFFFLFLCRATVQGRALHWTLEMARLWPTPMWAPLRTASNTSTDLWASTVWLRLERITLDQKRQHCTCTWQVSYWGFGCMYAKTYRRIFKIGIFFFPEITRPLYCNLLSRAGENTLQTHTYTHSYFLK